MGQVFLWNSSTPPSAPAVAPAVEMSWTVGDQTFNLLNPDSPVRLLQGIRGLTMPSVKHYSDSSPALDGSRWRGRRTEQREVFWPLLVKGYSGSQFVDHDRLLWETIRPDETGVWTVAAPDGQKRMLTMRFSDDGSGGFENDPVNARGAVYGITFIAEDPYWRGPVQARSWSLGTSEDFFDGANKAPVFNISQASLIASATLTNPGDIPVWPVWTVYGPSTAATLGLADHAITVPFTIDSDEALVVDTDPTAQTAFLYTIVGGELTSPVERTKDLGTTNFATIPSGQSVALALSLTGTGTIQCTLSPGYWRAM